jgi:hypothetical protein
MSDSTAEILSHIPNSGIVQMPGRRFPGLVLQGDSASNLYRCLLMVLEDAKSRRDEELYYEVLTHAQIMEGHLLHYEQTLTRAGIQLPWPTPFSERALIDSYDEA